MRTTSAVLLIAMVLSLGAATVAWADTCYAATAPTAAIDDGSAVIVLKNFTQPGAPNACDIINGYIANSPCMLSGNACRAFDNSAVVFQAESSVVCNIEVSWVIDPSTSSGQVAFCQDGTSSCFGGSVQKIPCPADRPFTFGPS